jgi:hypothetical protein
MLSLDTLEFIYEPFPIGDAKPVFTASMYEEIIRDWPRTELFLFKENLGKKYSLSEVNNAKQYYEYTKIRDFVHLVMERLITQHIDLGLQGSRVSETHAFSSSLNYLGAAFRKLKGRGSGKCLTSPWWMPL